MNFLKKLFNITDKEDEFILKQEVYLSLDDLFVHNFVEKGGKFLYCASDEEVINNLKSVILENNWNEIHLLDQELSLLFNENDIKQVPNFTDNTPIFTKCEHLIADKGDILFSSNQLNSIRLKEYPVNFIVFATTSQLVKDTGQGLTGIKTNCKNSLPTNISSVKNYSFDKNDDIFSNYGNSNSKNLYLLLFEDL